MRYFILIFLIINLKNLRAQNADRPVMDWAAFRAKVLTTHPLARQADRYRDLAAATLLRAQGGFDVKTFVEHNGKNFKNQTYYQHTEAGLKLPTYFGLELKSAYNLAAGDFLNDESRLPSKGQATLGLSWSLGQGLMIDERRAALRQARIGLDQGEAERAAQINDLLMAGAKAYWTWVVADNQLQVYREALRQALVRHEGIKESFKQGDKPGIDTVESYNLALNRSLDLNFAEIEWQNAALELSNYLWTDDEKAIASAQLEAAPVLFSIGNEASALSTERIADLRRNAFEKHPDLALYRAKLQTLDVERRLKIEKRKPVLDVEYNLLGSGWRFFPYPDPEGGFGTLASDVKWGLQFSYPIPNRKARGDLRLTDVKIEQNNLALRQKRQEVETKINQYANELGNLNRQIRLFQDIASNSRVLLDGEIEKMRFGESSVFLINTREQRWLDAQVKLLKLLGEYRKTEAGLLWAAGQL